MISTIKTITVTSAGGTDTINLYKIPDVTYVYPDSGSVVLGADYTLEYSALPPVGTTWKVIVGETFDLAGRAMTIFGQSYTTAMQNANTKWVYEFSVAELASPTLLVSIRQINLTEEGVLSGLVLIDASLTLAKFPALERGYVWVGDSTNRPVTLNLTPSGQIPIGNGSEVVSRPITGDISLSSTGVVTIANSVITNAKISASAAIAWNKMEGLTASKVAVTTASGVVSTANQLSPLLGGNGLDNSAATGFPIWNAGNQSVSSLTDMIGLKVSWETNYVGDFKIRMPFAGTVTGIYAFLDKAVGAADALVTPKNQAGTTMTDGVITFTASDPKGTAETSVPSANNTFLAGDVLTFTTSGGSAAGVAQLSITLTRTGLT